MPYDGLTMRAASLELNRILSGGRIDKAAQPERDEIHLMIRKDGESFRLVLSASPQYPRVHLTGQSKPGPLTAPSFCMALRKHLTGGRIVSIRQHDMERVLEIVIDVRDELGAANRMTLRAEVMGRHSNLILTAADGHIIDSVKHVAEDKSRVRKVLPGLPYIYPPGQGKIDPLGISAAELAELLETGGETPPADFLASRLAGLSAATVRAITTGAADPGTAGQTLDDGKRLQMAEKLLRTLRAVGEGQTQPTLIVDPGTGEAVDFFPFRSAAHPGGWQRECAALQDAMDEYYRERDMAQRLRERTAGLMEAVRRNLERCRRKLEKQRQTLDDAANMGKYRVFGELLTGNLHVLRKGMKSVTLPDWYDPAGGNAEIPLDPFRDGTANAQSYFKKYRKAKTAMELVRAQIDENLSEIAYLEGQLHNLSSCGTQAEAEEIRQELVREGYVRASRQKDRKDLPRSVPLHYRSSDGYDIYVGRNNLQNDALTLRFARPDDVWMHTRQIPGSHVIVRSQNGGVSDAALGDGALLAAWHSQARNSSSVPVDYTQRRHVKKPGGARPGYVIYSTNRTAYVTPDAARIARLRPADDGEGEM